MIAASGILVVVAFVTLILGVFREGLSFIWTSIAASVLAGIFLILGVTQGSKRRAVPAGGPSSGQPMPAWGDQTSATAVMERGFAPADEEPIAPLEPEPEPVTMVEEPPSAAAPAKAAAAGETVVIIPDRDKYHKETCRYAKNPAAMTMAKSSARRQGYKPCGTCKP